MAMRQSCAVIAICREKASVGRLAALTERFFEHLVAGCSDSIDAEGRRRADGLAVQFHLHLPVAGRELDLALVDIEPDTGFFDVKVWRPRIVHDRLTIARPARRNSVLRPDTPRQRHDINLRRLRREAGRWLDGAVVAAN